MSYKTGGPAPPRSGTLPGEGANMAVDVTNKGAGKGNNCEGPATKSADGRSPGGYGSTGSASSSSPSSG